MVKLLRNLGVLYLVALAFFIWGLVSAKLEVFPYAYIEPFYSEIHNYFVESHRDNVADIVKYDHQERKSQFGFSGFQKVDASFEDRGFLLLSLYSKEWGQVVVQLYSLATQQVVHTWVPDLDDIFKRTPAFNDGVNTRAAHRAQHPLLMDNGDIVIGSGEGPLARIDPCGQVVWAIERHFHHSIERNDDGNLIVPIIIKQGENDLGVPMREDGFAIVSPAGEILAEYSIYKILMDNGYRGLIYGVGEFEEDRFHLNDVQPIANSPELLLSIRNLSAIASLDLPSGRIQWLQVGPWVNQHDVNRLADGRLSIFGNDFSRGAWKLMQPGYSQVYIYDPQTKEVQTPYTEALKAAGMHSEYEGRLRILGNGDAFIEETNRDRLLRVSRDNIRWQYVNGISSTSTGALHLTRYLEATEVPETLLEKLTCAKP